MSSGKGISEFPDLEAKLQKPTKQSAFEKQKAEAEAKRLREEAETAAVYNEFVKSFDRDDDYDGHSAPSSSAPSRPRPGIGGLPPPSGPGRRHFGTSGLKSGPGSLGPPPSSFGKKRSFQDFVRPPREKGVLGYDEGSDSGGLLPGSKAFNTSDDEDMDGVTNRAAEKAIAKPTLRLSNIPPGTSPATVKALIPENLTVENVKITPSSASGNSERKHSVSIVTLSQDTPANEIDAAVNALQNQYLGYGYYLSLHRHLSSAVTNSAALPNVGSSSTSHPFGAKPVEQTSGPQNAHTQHGFNNRFAPPTSYGPPGAGVNRSTLLHVPVKPPSEVRTIQLISKVIESVLAHGPEFEALLMSRPEVQREEKWAWIWNARSQGGIWYRWRLWEVITGSQQSRQKGKYVPLFDGSHAWRAPEKNLRFEYTTKLDEFVSDSEYNSSDEEDFDDENKRENTDAESEKTFLNPLEKAKLTHLLARLPTSMSRLRKGDVARVTSFAITHASRGVDEVVAMITFNVEKPFALTGANPDKKFEGKDVQSGAQEEASNNEGPDISAASLVGLYVVSDILSSSSTSGVRHAWRFRQLFETSLKDRKTFETLGLMAERLKWGRLRAEKWKRSIHLVLNLWEGWCVFPAESQELFVRSFEYPPSLVTAEKEDSDEKKGRWKTVEDGQSRVLPVSTVEEADDVPGEAIDEDDVIGELIEEDDVERETIDEDDIEGEPIDEDDVVGEPMDEDEVVGSELPPVPAEQPVADSENKTQEELARAGQPRRRMRAVDMFADSDDSDKGAER
ncbi:U2 snRNP-associated SURP motif-containing protein [Fusarium austroafricanum]|uniref:U2 snRNP-associated SURP motif-containing protein n=1 Tax=Fusarium austroafricanum TaxID=2364996 RepID=A0A8H4P3D5_9HYPO|nr:U2 snRNP-associated SURP motif-containing protein [Fusarium austroafricanum]